MEYKTKINAEDNKQDLTIIREFDLYVELLIVAYSHLGFLVFQACKQKNSVVK